MDTDIVYIGMDLGTFQTSVACSNGLRDVVQTAVGWPKDHVARALLGRDVVFGPDIRNQRLALNVVRPFENGILKFNEVSSDVLSDEDVQQHKEAARLLVEHAVSLTQPKSGSLVYGVIGAPSRATILNKHVIKEAASTAFDAVVIVPEPFTVAFGMNRLTDTLVVDIGAGTIDICPMCGTLPAVEDQVTIPFGGDAVDQRLHELLTAAYPDVRASRNMIRDMKEQSGFVHDANKQVIVKLPTTGQPRQVDITEPLKEACRILVEPIVTEVRQVVSRFDPEFQQAILNNILLAGGGSQLNGLDRLIEDALEDYGGGRVSTVDDPIFAGAVGALKLAMAMPPERWEFLRDFEEKLAAA